MPDTQPITTSFPWLVVRYRPVFDSENLFPIIIVDDSNLVITDDGGEALVMDGVTPGDRYRLI